MALIRFLLASLTGAVSIALLFGLTGTNGASAHPTILSREELQARTVPAQNITFTNPAASQFYVDGNSIPLVDWDVGPSWAGLLPISSDPNETQKMFFWFFPPTEKGSLDNLMVWFNGGPGCSGLEGLLQENGPISWGYGQANATPNAYSWTNLSTVLWIENPIGTGFSEGTPTAKNEEDIAAQFAGFMGQFLNVFSELKGKKFWITGESYAETMIPYIADYVYFHPGLLDLNLQGIWMGDPIMSWPVVNVIPALDFVHKYEHVFSLNQTFLKHLDETAKKCHYAGYMEKYVTYPPKGPFPLPGKNTSAVPGCDVWTDILDAALLINPGFNTYRIFDMYPILWDMLGFPGTFPDVQVSPVYFDRPDVKQAIHAPLNTSWVLCSFLNNVSVFPTGDASLPPVFTVLPSVIEKSNRSVIIHGQGDYEVISEGSRIAIQKCTILLIRRTSLLTNHSSIA